METHRFAITPLEVIQDSRLTLIETRVLIALFSFRGKNTNLIWPTRSAIGERCGYAAGTVSNATKSLIEKGWLVKLGGVFQGPNRYEITVPILTDPMNIHQFGNPHRSGELNPHRSGELNPHRSGETEHTKNIPKNKPTIGVELPDWLNRDLWKAFVETRQTGKTKFTSHAKKLAITKLESLCPEGRGHEAVINQTIENGWKTFYPLKDEDRKLQEWLNG